MQQYYDENESPNIVEFELEKTELFQCAFCKKRFVRIKAYSQVLNPLWCNKCTAERKDILEATGVGVDFGQ